MPYSSLKGKKIYSKWHGFSLLNKDHIRWISFWLMVFILIVQKVYSFANSRKILQLFMYLTSANSRISRSPRKKIKFDDYFPENEKIDAFVCCPLSSHSTRRHKNFPEKISERKKSMKRNWFTVFRLNWREWMQVCVFACKFANFTTSVHKNSWWRTSANSSEEKYPEINGS